MKHIIAQAPYFTVESFRKPYKSLIHLQEMVNPSDMSITNFAMEYKKELELCSLVEHIIA